MKTPNADVLPTLACVGCVSQIELPKKSQTEGSPYFSMRVHLKGYGLSKDAKFSLVYDPTTLSPDFNVNNANFVYKKNIKAADAVSALIGLFGPDAKAVEANFDTFMSETVTDYTDGILVGTAIRDYLLTACGSQPVGYILKQQKQKTGGRIVIETRSGEREVDEKIRTPYYEVDSFFTLSQRAVKSLLGREARASEDYPFEVAFNPEDFGLAA
jgi:hypothetical protein